MTGAFEALVLLEMERETNSFFSMIHFRKVEMGKEERKIARHLYFLIRIRMACFGNFSVYRKNVFSKECKIHVFAAISWIIFIPVETHRKTRVL